VKVVDVKIKDEKVTGDNSVLLISQN